MFFFCSFKLNFKIFEFPKRMENLPSISNSQTAKRSSSVTYPGDGYSGCLSKHPLNGFSPTRFRTETEITIFNIPFQILASPSSSSWVCHQFEQKNIFPWFTVCQRATLTAEIGKLEFLIWKGQYLTISYCHTYSFPTSKGLQITPTIIVFLHFFFYKFTKKQSDNVKKKVLNRPLRNNLKTFGSGLVLYSSPPFM